VTDRPWVVVLLAPAPLYVALRYLSGFSLNDAALPIGFLLALAFGLATGVGLLRSPYLVWSLRAFFLLAVALAILPTFPAGATGLDFAAGVMLGLPFLALEGAWRNEYSPGSRLAAWQVTLFLGILYLAALPVVSAAGGPLTGDSFFRGLSQVIGAQEQGLLNAFGGSLSSASLPLANTLDPVFIGFAGLGFLGVVLVALEPRTAYDEPLPWAWGRRTRARTPGRSVDPGELRAAQREVLDSRTRPAAPGGDVPPGLGSLMLAALTIVGIVVGAIFLPRYLLVAIALGIVALIVGVVVLLSRRLSPSKLPPGPEGAGPAPSAPPPAGLA
jgi:hypothetical protein